ncbi:MAG: ATP-binding protein [Candidatus Altarchaeum sp.]|nr:ATP-binding protein [Candidatus Altarchaeum sp.]
MEFFDREDEKQEIMRILRAKPQLINFIYGLINYGKTTLITNLIEELPENYVVFYINLRRKSIIKYKDFIRVLFTIEEGGFLKKTRKPFG